MHAVRAVRAVRAFEQPKGDSLEASALESWCNYERFVILIYIAHEHKFNQRQIIFYEGKETKIFDISFTSYLLTSEVDANNHTRSPLLDLNLIYPEIFMPIEVRQYRRRRHARGKWDSYFYELDGSKSHYFEPWS